MATDYKKQWEEYKKLTFDERKEIVIGILESFRGQGEIFDLAYDYITRWINVTDQDLQDVYESLIKTAYQIDQVSEIQAIRDLELVRSKAVLMRTKEANDKKIAEQEASTLMNTI